MARDRQGELAGVLAACASSMLGGASVVATRAVVGATDPATLAALRYGIGAACLLPVVLLAGLKLPSRRDALPVALLGVLFFAGFPYLFNAALARTTAAHGSLALATLPFLTLLVARAVGAEALTGRKLLGVGLAAAGVAAALSGRLAGLPPGAWRGDLLMVATALCGAFFNVLSRPYLRRYPALSFTAAAMLAGAGATVALALAAGSPGRLAGLGAGQWGAVAFLGVAGAALTFYLWSYGLERTTPTGVAVTVALNPVVALALGVGLLGEPWGWPLLAGLAAVSGGVVLVNTRSGGPARLGPAPGRRSHSSPAEGGAHAGHSTSSSLTSSPRIEGPSV